MQIDGAIVKEQGVTFAVVVVKRSVLQSPARRGEAIDSFQPLFPGLPLVLMAQDSRGVPSYHGRQDIVKFLANIDHRRIPWKRYTVS